MPRRPLDAYETPPHYVQALLDVIGAPTGVVYEPCVGTGCISALLTDAVVFTNDIDPDVEADTHEDAATDGPAWGTLGFDWIITNPPFSLETEILAQALRWGKNLAFLARLSFLEPVEDRVALLQAHPPTGLVVLPRYSFRLNDAGKRATDSVTCCWLLWQEKEKPCLTVASRLS